jgi:glycosyltransferase involved in cell wall biosynthesis
MIGLASRRSISVSPKMLGEMTVSMLRGEDGFQQKEIGKFLDWLKTEDIPDIVSLPYTLLLGMARPIKEALGRPISCTLQGEDLFLEGLHEPYRTESKNLIKEQLKYVDGFISVSQYYTDFMPDYLGIQPDKIHTVPLGINLDGYSKKQSRSAETFRIGYFARLAPEKGLHVLVDAYQRLRNSGQLTNARLDVAGYLAPEHHGYLRDIESKIKEAGLENEFTYHGVVDREHKIDFLKQLDVLSVPATYDEPKGIFLLEAMACGVPVVQPRRGGFTEVVEKTGGGLLVEPDNVDSLAEGLLRLERDRKLADELGANGHAVVHEHFTVARMADRALEVYQHLIQHA